jgi:hypothetical protein
MQVGLTGAAVLALFACGRSLASGLILRGSLSVWYAHGEKVGGHPTYDLREYEIDNDRAANDTCDHFCTLADLVKWSAPHISQGIAALFSGHFFGRHDCNCVVADGGQGRFPRLQFGEPPRIFCIGAVLLEGWGNPWFAVVYKGYWPWLSLAELFQAGHAPRTDHWRLAKRRRVGGNA